MNLIAAALLVYSSNLGYGSLYPGVRLGVKAPLGEVEVRAAWSRKETPRPDGHFDYSGWGWGARAAFHAKHALVGGEVSSQITNKYTKTTWFPKAGAYWQTGPWGEVRVEALFPDSSLNKTRGLRLTHGIPEFSRTRMEWELDQYRPSDGHGERTFGGKITFSWGMN